MSNILTISVVELRVVGKPETEIAVMASDCYGSVVDRGFASVDEVKAKFPTKDDLLRFVVEKESMAGIGHFDGDEFVMDSMSGLVLEGYPE